MKYWIMVLVLLLASCMFVAGYKAGLDTTRNEARDRAYSESLKGQLNSTNIFHARGKLEKP